MAYEDFKDWARKTASDKRLHDKAFNIAKNPKYDGYYSRLASMGYKCFDKKTSGSGIKNENMLNKELAEEFHKPILRKKKKKKKKKKRHSPFIDNILGADLADMQLLSKFNEEVHYWLWVINIFSKYAWHIPFKR